MRTLSTNRQSVKGGNRPNKPDKNIWASQVPSDPEEVLKIFANLVIDRILEDRSRNNLKFLTQQ